jgi:hypothetical protein
VSDILVAFPRDAIGREISMQKSPDAVFFEEQPMRDNKLFYVMVAAGIGLIGFFGYGIYQQIVLGRPWGDRPMGDTALLAVGGLYILLGVLFVFFFWRGGLATEVRPGGLYVRYFPFHSKFQQIPLQGVRSCRSLAYRPILDYGGWGIRVGLGKRAYNVSGNKGVELEYEGGKRLLIGSKRSDQLAGAIESLRR